MTHTTEWETVSQQNQPKKNDGFLNAAFEWVSAAMVALMIVSLLFTTLFRLVNVDGHSMDPTLNHGERLVISNLAYTPDYGDIVIILRENDTPLIKRVIGLPGDTITINNDTGEVWRLEASKKEAYILDEPYIQGVTKQYHKATGMSAPVTVPEDYLYVLGDNREHSADSRSLGVQPMKNVVGRVLVRLFPFGKVE